ncbi:MAG: biotin/lipoate A/B protein ligase family protein [Limisphaerales bacterium]
MSGPGWYLLQQEKQTAAYNMALDETLLESAPGLGRPVLRFYGWLEPAASFGYAQKYADIERWTLLRPLVRRPTGGGLVPHDADWTYSVVIPARHPWHRLKAAESYRRVHEWIRHAFAQVGVPTTLAASSQKEMPGQCFVGAEKFDLMWHGRKIAGAAQRRTRTGLLIQGSIQPPPISVTREDWQSAMCEVARNQWDVEWSPLQITEPLADMTRSLQDARYLQAGYNQKR